MEESTVLTARSAGSPRPASPSAVRGLARRGLVAWPSEVDRVGVPPERPDRAPEEGAWGRGPDSVVHPEEEAGR